MSTMSSERRLVRSEFLTQWVILVAALVGLASVMAFALINQRAQVEKYEGERLQNQTRLVEKNLTRQLDSVNSALEGLILELRHSAAKDTSNFDDHLRIMERSLPGVRTLIITDASGRCIHSNRRELVGADLSGRDYFVKAKTLPDSSMAYVSPPFKSLLGVYVITVTRTMVGPKGEFAGVAVAGLDAEFFQLLLSSALYSPGMWAGLAHSDGLNFVNMPPIADSEGLNLKKPGTPFMLHLASGAKESLFTGTAAATGDERLFAVATVAFSEVDTDKPLVVALTRTVDAVYARWRSNLFGTLLLFAVIATFSIAGLWFYQKKRKEVAKRIFRDEKVIRELSEELKRFFDNSLNLMSISDLEGNIRRVNRAWTSTLGYEAEEMASVSGLDLVHPDDREETIKAMEALAEGKPVEGFVNRIRHKDTSYRWIEWHASPDESNTIYSAALDVTERKRLEDEREKLIISLRSALENVKTLKGLLPVCAWCRKIRNDSGYWQQLETYVSDNFDAELTHGICPDCAARMEEESGRKPGGGSQS